MHKEALWMQLSDMWLTELTVPLQRRWQSCGTGGDGCAGAEQAWLIATSSEQLRFQVGQLLSAVLLLMSASFFYCIPGPPESCWAGDGLCGSPFLGAVTEISSLLPFAIFCFPGLVNSIYNSMWFSSLLAAVGFCPLPLC